MKALILQGWYQKPSQNFYPWLANELKKRGYKVFLPDLPTMHTDLPDMGKQLDCIENIFTIDVDTIIFGHSIGCLLAMRLAEKHAFKKMFLISGWDFDELIEEHKLFWPNKLNHAKIKEHVKKIYCICSDNDPYITPFLTEEMSKRLGGKFVLIKGAGHFTEEYGITEISLLLEYI